MDPVLTAPTAKTATGTWDAFSVEKAKKVTLMFTRADDAGGNSAFYVQGSIDGSTYVTLNLLIDNVTNTNSEDLTRVAGCTLSTETSKVYAVDLDRFGFKFLKVGVTETTSGTHSYKALIEY